MCKCVECKTDKNLINLESDLYICDSCNNIKCFGCKECNKDIIPSEYYKNNGYCNNCK